MNMKLFLVGAIVLGAVAASVQAYGSDIPRELVQAYSPRAVATGTVFTPDGFGQTYFDTKSIHMTKEHISGSGSPYFAETMWKGRSYIQTIFPDLNLNIKGKSGVGQIYWAVEDRTIPFVYELSTGKPAEIDSRIISELTPKNPEVGRWDGRIRTDLCYGTGNASDFCDTATSKEMQRYRNTDFGRT